MTGYGSARLENRNLSIEVELRSVNHRFLTLQFRSPGDFATFEGDVEERARKRLQRGTLSVSVNVRRQTAPAAAAVVDMDQARAVVAGLKAMAKELKLSGGIKVETVASAPGVLLTNRASGPADDESRDLFIKVFEVALTDLIVSREREGAVLAADLRKRVELLRVGATEIESRAPRSVAEYQIRLRKRVTELMGDLRESLKEGDLAREIALLAEKSDVAEEVARLRAHIEELDTLLQKQEPVGRRIDFLLQEMGREVNTTGSKAFDTEITRIVMDLKAELERIREQSANLE